MKTVKITDGDYARAAGFSQAGPEFHRF
jgi:hypothetical protein